MKSHNMHEQKPTMFWQKCQQKHINQTTFLVSSNVEALIKAKPPTKPRPKVEALKDLQYAKRDTHLPMSTMKTIIIG